jgi:hypothetical protein
VAVILSVNKTADLSSFMDTFLMSLELRISAVLWTRILGITELVDLASFMDTFWTPWKSFKFCFPKKWILGKQELVDLSSFMDTFWTPWQSVYKSADLNSSFESRILLFTIGSVKLLSSNSSCVPQTLCL